MDCSTPGFPVHHQLPELVRLMPIKLLMPSNHFILYRSISSCLQSFPESGSFPMSQFFPSGGQRPRKAVVQTLSCVSLQPHGLQHSRLPCPPPPGICSNSCPLSCMHPTISSSVVPFSSCPQSFPTSGSFPMSWLFASGGQSIRVSASASVLPMNIQG